MVDFNNQTTVTTAPHDVLKIMILERRKYVLDALEYATKLNQSNRSFETIPILKSRMASFFFEIHAAVKNSYGDDKGKLAQLEIIKKRLSNNSSESKDASRNQIYNELIDDFIMLDEWCYEKNLTKFDSRKNYDSTDVELENTEKGL